MKSFGNAVPDTVSSVVDRAYGQLVEAIAEGRYAAGKHLSEARLTQELGVSRGSLREAIRQLSADGVLDIIPNRGAVVRFITQEEISEFFQLRGLYEGLASRRAAERIDETGNRRRTGAMLEEVERLLRDAVSEDFPEHNQRFHEAVMDMSGGVLLRREWARLRNGRQRLRHLQDMSPEYRHRSLEEHRAILRAILDGDAEAAERLAASHVDIARRHIQRMPPQKFDALVNNIRSGQAAIVALFPDKPAP